jgi:hypothetical protein
MSLAAHLESMQAIFMGAAPSDDELGRVGDPERMRIYRSMVRARLAEVVKNAYPRTFETLGAHVTEPLFEAYLAAGGPRTRYFWRVPLELLEPLLAAIPEGAPGEARDLALFEATRWRLRHEAFAAPAEATSLSFERPPLLNPAHALLRLGHRVDVRGEEHVEEERLLCLHRGRDHKVKVLVLNPTSSALVEAMGQFVDRSLTETVQHVARARGGEITASFISSLSALLELLLQKGLLLGSRR